MRLKSLQIKGFKSFANDTVLNFEHDVIGIVGPNGSGKSNIVDAMRWVLGEQKNKDLRLEQMKDIIFNGTANRKKAYKAEVSVCFDNTKSLLPTPYNTVKITRRLFQTGESEYALNDIKCRLKDIQNLFIDSGIGSNSYAIIELGMVDDILQDKENARRRMFEQAAGISKYKKRKKESLQKLQLTADDLDRLEDLLAEIKQNLDQLRKQARKAAKYKLIKEERKDKVLIFKKMELEKIISKKAANQLLLDKAIDSYNQGNVSLHELESTIERLKKDQIEHENRLSKSQKEHSFIIDEVAKLESDRKLNSQQITFSEENIRRLEQAIKEYTPAIEKNKTGLEKISEQIADIEQHVSTEQALLKSIEENFEILNDKIQLHEQSIESHHKERQNLSNKRYTIEKEIALLRAKMEQIRGNSEALDIREVELGHRMAQMIANRKAFEELQRNLVADINKLSLAEEDLQKEEEAIKKAIVALENKEVSIKRKIDASSNEKSLLSSMIENMEGYPAANKYVLQEVNPNLSILSEVIQITEDYKVAIESYLEPYLNYFISPNRRTAKKVIDRMAEAQKGRVSFFILDEIQFHSNYSEALVWKNALEFVDCDEIFKPLVQSLLHHVYIVPKDFDFESIELSKIEHPVSLLSGEGEFILSGNLMSGGSVGLFEGKKTGRKKQLQKIVSDISTYKAALKDIIKERDDLCLKLDAISLKLIQEKRQEKQNELQEIKYKFDLNDHDIDVLNQEQSSIRDKKKKFTSELHIAEESLIAHNNEQESCLKALNELEKNIGEGAAVKHKLSDDLAVFTKKLNHQQLLVIKDENRLQQAIIIKEHLKQSVQDLTRKIEAGKKDLLLFEEKKEKSNKYIIKCEEELERKYAAKAALSKDLSIFEQDYFKARGEIHEWEEKLKELNRILNQDQVLINQYKDVLMTLRFEREKIEERVRVEFNEEISSWQIPNDSEVLNRSDLEMQIERLERKLQAFTEVNPLALEAYEELEIRYKNIIQQRDDILSAKEDLLKTIKEIEGKATSLFLSAFQDVRKYFVQVFRSLFTKDDDCDLILLDPSDPLNSEIEILAKPKGKRPKSLSQLSGGEKTLTATALLFSLYLLKPAPFCILDEVDAPLDDNNVQKFGNIIRAFSKDSQFLMITHNKLTMAEVDILYGIFMQEKGISQVAPVDLTMLAHEKRIGELLK